MSHNDASKGVCNFTRSTRINKKRTKYKQYKRKVVLIRNENNEMLILTKIINNRKTLNSEQIDCTKTIKEYPKFRAQLKERIVPRCLRTRCRCYSCISRKPSECTKHKYRQNRQRSKNGGEKEEKEIRHSLTTAIITNSICPDTYSSNSEDEIEILIASTRKSMKSADEEWTLVNRQFQPTLNKLDEDYKLMSRSLSINSLDTLVLEENREMNTVQNNSSNKIQGIKIKQRSLETNDNKIKNENFSSREDQKEFSNKNEINAVIVKLEDVDYSLFNKNKFDITQELRGYV